jgi:hypothetical protein
LPVYTVFVDNAKNKDGFLSMLWLDSNQNHSFRSKRSPSRDVMRALESSAIENLSGTPSREVIDKAMTLHGFVNVDEELRSASWTPKSAACPLSADGEWRACGVKSLSTFSSEGDGLYVCAVGEDSKRESTVVLFPLSLEP